MLRKSFFLSNNIHSWSSFRITSAIYLFKYFLKSNSLFFNSDPLKKPIIKTIYTIYIHNIYDNIVRYIHACPYVHKFVLVGSRSKATIHNRCVYINRNRRRKIIGRGNSLSASIRSSTPPLAHYTIIYYFVAFRKFGGWPIRKHGSNKKRRPFRLARVFACRFREWSRPCIWV